MMIIQFQYFDFLLIPISYQYFPLFWCVSVFSISPIFILIAGELEMSKATSKQKAGLEIVNTYYKTWADKCWSNINLNDSFIFQRIVSSALYISQRLDFFGLHVNSCASVHSWPSFMSLLLSVLNLILQESGCLRK